MRRAIKGRVEESGPQSGPERTASREGAAAARRGGGAASLAGAAAAPGQHTAGGTSRAGGAGVEECGTLWRLGCWHEKRSGKQGGQCVRRAEAALRRAGGGAGPARQPNQYLC